MLLGVSWLCQPLRGEAAAFWEQYVPPELVYADDLRQTVRLTPRLNINQSTVSQLETLPGFSEEMALKVIRSRPFADIQDFYHKMPGMDKKSMDRLIQQVQPKIRFK